MTTENILTAHKIISEIMEKEHMTKDTSFMRVRAYLANLYCDMMSTEYEMTRTLP